ncbi:hypothetical protein Pmar_PMAR023454 [Perkinsus marinus ATCC 50983]|uniref:Uncharacterized protein n=1 Tax=Perkinsus marinus (strain ATCC 50983 / TXsc) TaxID=423536 RepID=C5KKL6_PERM5|nr:hypothetical protein Pmar_PMAR023454 [Perkinsus marinus ATCC 50983]EER15128.1 hypothetical protein Pmar_PMAR023454 [Perkinsus marinus ATCC 50983]|eukprot:XP_002783332.1 hypothetical protein Pmar_PMAR023454 [Perkinsus marinus ATCC 50983]
MRAGLGLIAARLGGQSHELSIEGAHCPPPTGAPFINLLLRQMFMIGPNIPILRLQLMSDEILLGKSYPLTIALAPPRTTLGRPFSDPLKLLRKRTACLEPVQEARFVRHIVRKALVKRREGLEHAL